MLYAILDEKNRCFAVGVGKSAVYRSIPTDDATVEGKYYYDGQWEELPETTQADRIEADTAYLVLLAE